MDVADAHRSLDSSPTRSRAECSLDSATTDSTATSETAVSFPQTDKRHQELVRDTVGRPPRRASTISLDYGELEALREDHSCSDSNSEKYDDFDADGLQGNDAQNDDETFTDGTDSQAESLGSDCDESSFDDATAMTSDTEDGYSTISGDVASEDSDEYAELMASMPIALGRKGGCTGSRYARPLTESGTNCPLPIPCADEGMNPLEGLAMLQSIRSDLEKVGNMIVKNKDGEAFLRRAHVLASINLLARNVPACILEHLGTEIRNRLRVEAESKALQTAGAHCGQRRATLTKSSFHSCTSSSGVSLASLSSYEDVDDGSIADFDLDLNFDEVSIELPTFGASGNGNPRRNSAFECSPNVSGSLERGSQFARIIPRVSRSRSNMSLSTASTMSHQNEALPWIEYFDCALLFVDISGFTKLSTILEPESLSKVINSYFQLIVDKVFQFGGDIQKFAGDALFAEWRASSKQSLQQCVESATICAVTMVRDCADFPVMAFGGSVTTSKDQGSPVSTLNVHAGLSVGRMGGIHVGDSTHRREYVYFGEPISQATKACDMCKTGELRGSTMVCDFLAAGGALSPDVSFQGNEPVLLAQRETVLVSLSDLTRKHSSRERNAKSRGVTDQVDGLATDALIEYRRLISLYVHPVVVADDIAASDNFRSSSRSTGHASQNEAAELRSVYTMFLNAELSVQLKGNITDDQHKMDDLNDIMNLVTRELRRYCGHLRQFIVDDKGVVIIATFGLRGSTFPKMVSDRALPATIAMYNGLLGELGVESRIGATFGDAYCGLVGGEQRHEYAVMGPSVNLAARLMCHPENPGVLVDSAVRKLANKSYVFNALPPIRVKGYSHIVAIFEPLSPLEQEFGRLEPNFVGRREQMTAVLDVTRNLTKAAESRSHFVFIAAPSGFGKTALVTHTIEYLRRRAKSNPSPQTIAKHVSSEGDSLVPFSTIKPLFLKVLGQPATPLDDSTGSGLSLYSSMERSRLSLSTRSCALSTAMSLSMAVDRLEYLCEELEASPSLTYHLKVSLQL
jgi:class 3 adenylate cyclase